MKQSLIFFVVIALSGIYSFINIPPSNYCQSPQTAKSFYDRIPAYKIETASTVFNHLKRALGILSSEKPNLYLVKQLPNPRFKMAMIFYEKGAIYLEEEAYDLCTTFGKDSLNALAIYLGHELSHLTGKHNVTNHYAWDYEKNLKQDTLFKQLEKSLPEDKKDELLKVIRTSLRAFTSTENEKDADLSGGFLSYLSGYQTFGISPQLLDKTYKDFNLPKNPKGYPSLEQRKQIAVDSDKKLKDLIDLFEMGNLLVALTEYDDAILYYNKVLQQFKSREIYNNIGVLYTLSFLKKASKKKIKYAFPVELDAETRLSFPASKGNEENEKRKLWLAIENFEKANNLDKDYPIAHLNKSCAHTLLGLHANDVDMAAEEFAIAIAETLIAKRLAKKDVDLWKKTLTDTYTQNGIIEALKGNKSDANILFKEALKLSPKNHLAVINYNILNEIEAEKSFGFANKRNVEREIIDDIPIEKIQLTRLDIKDTIDLSKNNFVRLIIKRLDRSKLMTNHVLDKSERYASFHLVDSNYKGTTVAGIKINDNLDDIKDKYGEPDTYFELGQGSWLIYKNSRIIFQINVDGKLVRWSVFNHKM